MRMSGLGLLSLLAMASAAVPARAAIYLKYGDIQGDVTVTNFTGDISVDSFSLSLSRAVSTPTGGTNDRESDAPLFSDVTIAAPSSIASVPLFTQAVAGSGETANLYITETFGKGIVATEAEWDFGSALVSSFATGDSAGGNPEDDFSLNFLTVTYTWNNLSSGGQILGTQSVTYNIGMAKVTSSTSTGDVSNFAFITSAPEPASAFLLLAGIPLLLKRRR